MKTKRLCWLMCLVWALSAALVTGPEAEAAEKPSIAFLIAALKHQEASCGSSLHVKYTRDGLGKPKAGSPHYDGQYIRTPTVLFKEEKKGSWKSDVPGSYDWCCGNNRYSFDRTLSVCKALSTGVVPNTWQFGVITRSPVPHRMGELMDPVLFNVYGEPLVETLRDGIVIDTQDTIDGRQCWRIDIPEKKWGTEATYLSHSLWVDPEIGFSPRRIVTNFRSAPDANTKDAPTMVERDFTDYKTLSSEVHFPMRIITKYDRSETNGWVMTAQEAACGKEVSADDISVVFPSGMKVRLLPDNVEATIP